MSVSKKMQFVITPTTVMLLFRPATAASNNERTVTHCNRKQLHYIKQQQAKVKKALFV